VGCIQHTQQRFFFQEFSRQKAYPPPSHPPLLSM
jgi:hypothetical protein